MCAWSDSFLQLQDRGIITGFALITARGPLQPATGTFQAECAQGILAAVQQLVKSFYSASDPPTSYELWGSKLLVVHQTDSCFVAVSKQRQLGIVAVNLPSGVLLASFSRPVLPTAALTEVQASCAAAFSGS
uniref:Profilin n=1 Tax=Tetradesmus obliquus TaxID=3088 RepID=A0A383W4B8_TETOB